MWWEREKPKVLVGICHIGLVTMEWSLAFRNLKIPEPYIIKTVRGSPVDRARNMCVETALESNAEYVFFLDSDVIVSPDSLQRLMSYGLPVVSGLYYTKGVDSHPCAWRFFPGKGLLPVESGSGLVEVDAVGAGFLLVDTRVFRKLKPPWFRWTEGFSPHPWNVLKNGLGVSEDFYFCYRVKEELGLKIYVDFGTRAKHASMNVNVVDGKFTPQRL